MIEGAAVRFGGSWYVERYTDSIDILASDRGPFAKRPGYMLRYVHWVDISLELVERQVAYRYAVQHRFFQSPRGKP